MPTRSGVIRSGRVPGATNALLFSVPADLTVILKNVQGYPESATPHVIHFYATRAGQTLLVHTINSVPGQGFIWNPWMCFDPGSSLLMATGSDGFTSYWVSGAILPGVAQSLPTTKPG